MRLTAPICGHLNRHPQDERHPQPDRHRRRGHDKPYGRPLWRDDNRAGGELVGVREFGRAMGLSQRKAQRDVVTLKRSALHTTGVGL